MKPFLRILVLLMPFCAVAEETEKQQLSQKEIQQMQAIENAIKEKPGLIANEAEVMERIKQTKEKYGITDETKTPSATGQVPAVQQTTVHGSPETAEDAYKNKDYETAFAHYKDLAEKGDPHASLMLGVMYHQGQGTDKDPGAAAAWFQKGQEEGSTAGIYLTNAVDREMSEEERQNAEKKYIDIHTQTITEDGEKKYVYKEQLDSGATLNIKISDETVKQMEEALTEIYENYAGYAHDASSSPIKRTKTQPVNFERTAKITPEKNSNPLHYRPDTQTEQYQPGTSVVHLKIETGTEPYKIETGSQNYQPGYSKENFLPEKFRRN